MGDTGCIRCDRPVTGVIGVCDTCWQALPDSNEPPSASPAALEERLAAAEVNLALALVALRAIADGVCELKYIGSGEYVSDGKCAEVAARTIAQLEGKGGR